MLDVGIGTEVAEHDGLGSEVHGRNETAGKVFVEPEFTQYADRETRIVMRDFSEPLVAVGIGVAVVLELEIHHIETEQEAIVIGTTIDIRPIHHLAYLSRCRKLQKQAQEKDNMSYCSVHLFIITKSKPIYFIQ